MYGNDLNKNNEVEISGLLVGKFEYSHMVLGEKFYDNEISVLRESGTTDEIPIVVSECLIMNLDDSMKICVKGDIRTYNTNNNNVYPKIKMYVFVNAIEYCENKGGDNDDLNNVRLIGVICKEPIYRQTPTKRKITELVIAVNRVYGKSDYIPCIVWGRHAILAKDYKIGQKIYVDGRIQSRTYTKYMNGVASECVTREISVNKIGMV